MCDDIAYDGIKVLALKWGQNLFESAIFNSENLDTDAIYDALDSCNNAKNIAFNNLDTELEVRCEAFNGLIYWRGLKYLVSADKQKQYVLKAKTHMSNAVRLEATLRPRNCSTEEWFIKCKRNLMEIN